jgi:hypothetical protein
MAFSHFGSEPHFTVMSYSGLDLPPPLDTTPHHTPPHKKDPLQFVRDDSKLPTIDNEQERSPKSIPGTFITTILLFLLSSPHHTHQVVKLLIKYKLSYASRSCLTPKCQKEQTPHYLNHNPNNRRIS